MSMLDKDRVDNLATRVQRATEEAAEKIMQFLMTPNERHTFAESWKQLEKLAAEATNTNDAELAHMAEHDDNNPKYQLYYSELSAMLMKTLGHTIDRMTF